MTFDYVIAKTLFKWKSTKESEVDIALTNALLPAKTLFKSKISVDEYKRYVNTTQPITITSIDSDNITVNYDDAIIKVKAGDFITLGSLVFEVLTTGSEYFTLDNEYTGAETTFTIDTMTDYEMVYALAVVYWFTNTERELNLDVIFEQNQEFGSGNINPIYDPIEVYKNDKLKEMADILGPIKASLGTNTITPQRR